MVFRSEFCGFARVLFYLRVCVRRGITSQLDRSGFVGAVRVLCWMLFCGLFCVGSVVDLLVWILLVV